VSARFPWLPFALAALLLASPGQAEVAGQAEIWFEKGHELAARSKSQAGDPLERLRWYLKAARAGHPRAQVQLALALQRGDGIERDASRSTEWFRKAAEQGNPKAMLELGIAYRDGIGVPVDLQRALMWLRLAQLRGSGIAGFVVPSVRRGMSLEQVQEAQRLSAAWFDERNFEVKSSPRFRATNRPDMRFGAKALAPAAGEGPTDEPDESAAPTPSG